MQILTSSSWIRHTDGRQSHGGKASISARARAAMRGIFAQPLWRARGSVWLWDEPDSDLVRIAIAQGARVHPFPGVRNRQEVSEVLCEIRRIPDGLPPLFAWARQNGLDI